MSPVVTRPEAADPQPAAAGGGSRGHRSRVTFDRELVAAGALAAALVAIAFLTKASFAGANLGANTWTEIVLVVVGAGLFGAVALLGGPGRFHGLSALALFAVLAALTYASIGWSVQPDNSWLEGNRTLAYLAAFGGAIALSRLAPNGWRALIGGVAIASLALSAWALLTKVFPSGLDASDTLGRLNAPFGYWNAIGLAAAIGLPGCLWAGARERAGRLARTVAVPAITVLVVALVMSYGRGALAAAVVGLAIWFAAVPFRLRAALVLALGVAGAGGVLIWALNSDPLTHDNAALSARVSTGHTFGLVLVVGLLVVTAAGYAAAVLSERATVPAPARRRVGFALLAAVGLLAVGGIAAVAASRRGLTGEISHVWNQLTTSSSHVGSNPSRLVQLGSSRPLYWHEGLLVGAHHPFVGAGAGSFQTASLRYVKSKWAVAAHAHSYLFQTFADLGVIGLAVSLAVLVAWGLAAARALSIRAPRAGPEHGAERTGMFTLLAVVVIFGVHSAIDWTWFVPGVALPALICAGWLAGRGPLGEPASRLTRLRGVGSAPAAYAGVTLIAAVGLTCAWFVWQPLRAANADAAAVTDSISGNTRAAFADARAAVAQDPESVEPLDQLSSLYVQVGLRQLGRIELLRAASLQPANPQVWVQLGEYDLLTLHRPAAALGELRHARLLDPSAPSIGNDIAAADAAIAAAKSG